MFVIPFNKGFIGEQKIDFLVVEDETHPFTRIALREGMKL